MKRLWRSTCDIPDLKVKQVHDRYDKHQQYSTFKTNYQANNLNMCMCPAATK